jgi:serine/threonine-protein kinase HipA
VANPILLDVYVQDRLVGTLGPSENGAQAFNYLTGLTPADFVSLTMPVRFESYVWSRGLHPFFQMNLPEGYKKDILRNKLGPHAEVDDVGLLALTGNQTIGRVRIVPRDQPLQAELSKLKLASLLASPNSRDHLIKYLEDGVVEGISGVMPKSLQFQNKATTTADEYILKTGLASLPGLAINEYLCLEVARKANLIVPEATLSEDGEVLAVKRFDQLTDGSALGVEDFCSLKGLDPIKKYQGTLEDLAKLLGEYVPKQQFAESAKRLFKLLLLNYGLRNADAHLKNYAVTYTSFADVALAPVYDIVTVTAYPAYQDSLPGLTLGGKKVWRTGKLLHQYGATRLSLPAHEMAVCLTEVTSAINEMIPILGKYASTYPAFRETAKRMLTEWELGIEDIQPQTTSKIKPQLGFKAIAGLSDETEATKKVNVYKNPDGGFSHKAR